MVSPKKIATAFTLASVFPGTLALKVCTQIQQAISSASAVYYPGSANYTADVAHWVTSSIDPSACTVEPGTAADVSTIIKLLGQTRTPFAGYSYGDATNPGWSSSLGVQIAMTRFNAVKYDKQRGTIAIGLGLIWDDVYPQLEPYGVIPAGGRVPGIGVAGFTLGGGYNWLANEVGLTVDTVLGYQLVQPNGDTAFQGASNPDLFFALKGGYNNFDIVTQFTFKAYTVGQIWGGFVTYGTDQIAEFNAAFADFAVNTTDPKAAIVAGYAVDDSGEPIVVNILFYKDPSPPAGVFDKFLAIKNTTSDVGTRSVHSLVEATPQRYFDTLSFFEYTPAIIDAIVNETMFWGARLAAFTNATVGYHVEPFINTLLTHNTTATAWPFFRTKKFVPLQLQFTWTSPEDDTTMREFMEQSAAHLTNVANKNGQAIQQLPLYPNYGLFSSPAERIYGSNLPRLQAIKAHVDPHNVMGLAGGWKV
ncbi:FAD-binding domain-containing protein [Mycena metata]|uniref:FAD-binding domain-containing protein n=1 Tax=Mycena metata TaxID=1033252 RepID=A0AAD7HWF6_9AGAR|nr:FAD-binding domain-containing protein [Mycena metata]